MGYDAIPYEKRIKENIRNYSLSNLYNMESIKKYLGNLAEVFGIDLLLTDRHGEKEIVIGDGFLGVHPDVANAPGRKLRIQGRTVGHLYIKEPDENQSDANQSDGNQSDDDRSEKGKRRLMDEMLDQTVELLAKLGEEAYLRRESSIYLEELEKRLADKIHKVTGDEREDILTGVFNKLYFESKMKVIDRSEVIPVAVLNVNINDWKYANDHFGDEESDRLIRIVADILKEEAGSYFIIGRIDGDVFGVLIPMAEDGEAEDYASRVQERCFAYEDAHLAPSVAVGIVYKTNIEETLEEKLSDAEYEMFENKFNIKNSEGYRQRLEKKN